MERVLGGRQWLYEQNLLVLWSLKPGDVPLRVPLNEAEFWVQVHNVPYDYMNLGVARRVDNFIGKFINFDKSQFEESWNSYMRIRVCMDVGKAMKIGMTLRKGREAKHRVDFKYEKLSSFCFACSIIGHADRFFPLPYECEKKVMSALDTN
ncbi:unnamed protein product [Cuscuta epithymum]|uniref:Zinc knuckle CX2CX4HX4C domain-containing protein n=1 Tax=Cuscuta epithymum TaxID=186058 RepID=A0AAV0CYG6_9ASTE|nr:unnamed protein product [Cuscuta epithymum]